MITVGITIFLLVSPSFGFLQSSRRARTISFPLLYGLPEWRQQATIGDNRPILLLPFRANEAILRGQSTEIVLKDGRFFDLFQDTIDEHESILGMALMGDDRILDEIVLCQIHDFKVDAGFRGRITINVTLKAVGRATMVELTQMKPIMTGVCREVIDEPPAADKMSSSRSLVSDIELIVQELKLQPQYSEACKVAMDESIVDDKIRELTAASWAALVVSDNKAALNRAIACTSVTKRLQLGLKLLLEEKFKMSSSEQVPFQDNDVGFE